VPRLRTRFILLSATVALIVFAVVCAAFFDQRSIILGRRNSPKPKTREKITPPVASVPSVAYLIEEQDGIEVVYSGQDYPVKTYHGPIQAATADPSELDRYWPILAHEFLIYPPSLIKRTRLKRIVLCRDLSFAGQVRTAIPDYEHDTLYLDVVRGAHSRTYQGLVIHHEFFHVVDYQDDGQVYSDERWARLNPATFRYGNGGVAMQGNAFSSLATDRAGFLTTYATSGVEEDKAEIFAHLMTEYVEVTNRAARDDVLARKMTTMKALLKTFCSEIDDAFWTRVSRRQIFQ
jgi:Putative zinc-binding metallo-peptidase